MDRMICNVCQQGFYYPTNPLETCRICEFRVHQSCYGFTRGKQTEHFYCYKCRVKPNREEVACELCPVREGIFRPILKSKKFAHVLCALCVPGAKFVENTTMEVISIEDVAFNQRRKCVFCERAKSGIGGFVKCAREGCKSYVHATCCAAQRLLKMPQTGTLSLKRNLAILMKSPPKEIKHWNFAHKLTECRAFCSQSHLDAYKNLNPELFPPSGSFAQIRSSSDGENGNEKTGTSGREELHASKKSLTGKEPSTRKKPSTEGEPCASKELPAKEGPSVEAKRKRTFSQPSGPAPKRRRVESPSTSHSNTAHETPTESPSNRIHDMPKTFEELFEWEFRRNSKFLIDNAPTSKVASLLSNFLEIKRENEKLQAEIIKLQEKEAFWRNVNERLAKSIAETEGSSRHKQSEVGQLGETSSRKSLTVNSPIASQSQSQTSAGSPSQPQAAPVLAQLKLPDGRVLTVDVISDSRFDLPIKETSGQPSVSISSSGIPTSAILTPEPAQADVPNPGPSQPPPRELSPAAEIEKILEEIESENP